jgi:hypothetical protein
MRFAMTLGLPQASQQRPTFHFDKVESYPPGTSLDNSGKPFDPKVRPSITAPPPVQVPCAVEFSAGAVRNPDEIPIGTVREVSAVITLLDEDFAKVEDAVMVTLGGDDYRISFAQSIGLFDITVHQFNCFAMNED